MTSPILIKTAQVVATVVGVSLTTFGSPGVSRYGLPILLITSALSGGHNAFK